MIKRAVIDRSDLVTRLKRSIGVGNAQQVGPSTNILLAGPWGSGKSHILDELKKDRDVTASFQIIYFAPNRLAAHADPRLALIQTIHEKLKLEGVYESDKSPYIRIFKKVCTSIVSNGVQAIGKAAAATLPPPLGGFVTGCTYDFANLITNLLSKYPNDENSSHDPIQDEQDKIRGIIKCVLNKLANAKASSGSKKKVLLLVDDIDRTFPEQAVAFLDDMYRLILPNDHEDDDEWPLISVWAVNTDVLEEYLYREYREVPSFEPSSYLEKMFRQRISVPPIFAPSDEGIEEDKTDSTILWEEIDDITDTPPTKFAKFVNYQMLGNLRLHERLRSSFRRYKQDKACQIDQYGTSCDIDIRSARLLFLLAAFSSFRDHIALYNGMWPQFLNRLNRRHVGSSLEMIANPTYRHLDNADLATVLMELGVLDYDAEISCYVIDEAGKSRLQKDLLTLSRYGY